MRDLLFLLLRYKTRVLWALHKASREVIPG